MFDHEPALQQQLRAALAAKGEAYVPRTRHLDAEGKPLYVNRLICQDSPYLLQHAHNPVDWYPWGEEAFARARQDDKPVFLSIGYSTCHWCHVMEVESFDDEDIAAYLNTHFLAIKVDRELLPDIDALYMAAVMMLSGQGGWPMSNFLTAEGRPFFGGTYYPPQQFLHLLQQVQESWQGQRAALLEQAERISGEISRVMTAKQEAEAIDEDCIKNAVQQILGNYDARFGGFGRAPKFPNEPWLFLLQEVAVRTPAAFDSEVVAATLEKMARGGIYDQIGGGFHRYSTDEHWLVPHFEKMLYNQANLARLYLRAYELSGNPFFRQVAEETLDYVLREMTDTAGGFYSATDADSEGREGLFFMWDREELAAVLSEKAYQQVVELYGVSDKGNFEGSNILYLAESYEDYAAAKGLELDALQAGLAAIKEKLRTVRSQRIPPLRDDKIITAWNGMMITAFAMAGRLLGREDYLQAATAAARYLLDHNRQDDGRLWRASLAGHPSIDGRQEDYACLAEALVQLYDDTGDRLWLAEAEALIATMTEAFADNDGGGFFMSAAGPDLALPARPKDLEDNAVPSGNAVALRVLVKLARRTGNEDYRQQAEALLAGLSARLARYPHAHAYLLTGLLELQHQEYAARQYAGGGKLVISTAVQRIGADVAVSISVQVAAGWHINAHGVSDGELVGTQLELDGDGPWRLGEVRYPEADWELALYQDTVTITAMLEKDGESRAGFVQGVILRLRLQACSDAVCLAPETVPIFVSTAGERDVF